MKYRRKIVNLRTKLKLCEFEFQDVDSQSWVNIFLI